MAEVDDAEGRFAIGEKSGSSNSTRDSDRMSNHSPLSSTTTVASITALQYLPIPLLVLSSQKTVILANEAMGRLLGIGFKSAASQECTITEVLRDKRMTDLGIDILQHHAQSTIPWEDFLDCVIADSNSNSPDQYVADQKEVGNKKPAAPPRDHQAGSPYISSPLGPSTTNLLKATICDVAVEVAIAPLACGSSSTVQEKPEKKTACDNAIQTTCVISSWSIEDTQYFTLTFTSATTIDQAHGLHPTTRIVNPIGSKIHPISHRPDSISSTDCRSGDSSNFMSKAATPILQQTEGPLRGPPIELRNVISTPASIFQKASQLKDAILNSISMPAYAMWRDEGFGIPNKALLRLLPKDRTYTSGDQREFLEQYTCWTEDFQRELGVDEFPIIQICRTRQRVDKRRIGMRHPLTGSRIIFEISGEPVVDDETGEFLGGIVVFKDVTDYTKRIAAQAEENERQFEYIANFMPAMVWTTTADGIHDWFSQRWYDYTGLTVEESLGEGWKTPIHPEDLVRCVERWSHSLQNGVEYNSEHRCRRYDGEWHWMLGRALPFYDDSGRIIKWFGTCIDIHDQVEARQDARRTRERLQKVIEHAKITLWAVNHDHKLVLFEGDTGWKNDQGSNMNMLGQDIDKIFGGLQTADRGRWKQRIENVLRGKPQDEIIERAIYRKRYYRTSLAPLWSTSRVGSVGDDACIDGVIGISVDVTELRERENQLKEQEEENDRLQANAAAAKEASRMKSQFLANMSHEIRTPIAGVIGMSELLLDMSLDDEQKECAENIHRSANGLLTVINDILDFSKVESGRLDMEEVHFSLPVVLRDINKMMSFAAQRKGLVYESFIQPDFERDLRVTGDPGRLRQVLTNLLANSIKFTSKGSVKLTVSIKRQTKDTVTVSFTVQDTGIGIEEEVRKRLFQPFTQADSSTARRFGGTGLGLTISKNLVELMKGQISLDSKLGLGTTATFWVPFSRAPYQDDGPPLAGFVSIPDLLQSDASVSSGSSEELIPTPRPESSSTHKKIQSSQLHSSNITNHLWNLEKRERQDVHVLVVEDNPINQQIALKATKKLHFSVNAVWNGQEALDYLTQEFTSTHPRPDIILMDVQMPIRDGYSATHAIRTEAPWKDVAEIRSIPIIAMTASAIHGEKEKCTVAGMDDYLTKPVKGKLLEKTLVKWTIERRRSGGKVEPPIIAVSQYG